MPSSPASTNLFPPISSMSLTNVNLNSSLAVLQTSTSMIGRNIPITAATKNLTKLSAGFGIPSRNGMRSRNRASYNLRRALPEFRSMALKIYREVMDREGLRLRRVEVTRRCRRVTLVLTGWIYRSIGMRGICRISCRWRWRTRLGLGRSERK